VKVLVVGNGGREHALAWKLLQSPNVHQVYCAPGNGGTAQLDRCQNLALAVDDFEGLGGFCTAHQIAMVLVGPEVPLALGITDYLKTLNIPVFGPSKAGAQIEASKAWAKALMVDAGIPTAKYAQFSDAASAKAYVEAHGAPIVIKADGLAAGKGVTVAASLGEAWAAIDACFSGQFGEAGQTMVIEECLMGQEASILAITDGHTIRPLLPAQDHKRIGEGDTGENTGGMGVYAPAPIVTPALLEQVQQQVLEPAIAELKRRNIPYCGILYAGLMITPEGEAKVIEFNCRFGDPETQAIMPLLKTPLDVILTACIEGTLERLPPLAWNPGTCACVVTASGGYPGKYQRGIELSGIPEAEANGAVVFHAGTQVKAEKLLTDGGRVLGVCGTGETFDRAFAQAYAAVAKISYEGKYYRRDIGYQVRSAPSLAQVLAESPASITNG
jgi:phosphoribosylamine---glycine ligase